MGTVKPLRVLVVDDDKLDRIAVRRALSKVKNVIDISEAATFEEATSLLLEENYDCLLFDYRLGGKNGIELIQLIQNEGLSHAPIVMLSGIDDEFVMLNCLKEGAQDFLLKSEITTHSLVRAIRYAQERKQISLQMRFLAQHDMLTGLANRSLFIESVRQAIARSQRDNTYFAIMFIDVDNFKSVNDTLGHEAGDELLTTIADLIKSALRDNDVVGRLGGDEFSVLIEGVEKQGSLIKIAQQLVEAIREPITIQGKLIHTSISLGIATYPTCSSDVSALIKCADLAMYKAKQSGRNGYCFYSDDLQMLADEYVTLKTDLHKALKCKEFELYYQPQINVSDGTIAGVEALIRWNHPVRGMVSPDEFIPVAETVGLINDIGDWVIEEACQQLQRWLSEYKDLHLDLVVAINVSAYQLRQLSFKKNVFNTVKKYGLPFRQVELELTESAVIEDVERCATKLKDLSGKGIQVAIDDFGTGFSSFRHLQLLPLKTLKIDKIFIDEICTVQKSREIVKSMIMMAHALDMDVVAEGVETESQASLLKILGCDKLQGYYFSRPLKLQDMNRLLESPGTIAIIKDASEHLLTGDAAMKSTFSTNKKKGPFTILLVDDDDLDAKAIERSLRKQDDPPKLVRVVNGFQALEKLKEQSSAGSPYLVLLDINMPKMGGIEFLDAVRRDPNLHRSTVFVLTTSIEEKDKLSAYNYHVAGYIVKSDAGPDYCHLSKMIKHYQNTVSLLH
ncbi:hypothetical protein A9Q81_13465 [Gammaproteobacteria bacterium 42_54_T18]|nr:hypothetical protein A9Q81_13465 [Gammaproteobacteria bacterium 42_54_T18]